MMTTATGAAPTPEHLFNALNAHQLTAALKTAIELDIFTKIGEGANEAGTLGKAVDASEKRGVHPHPVRFPDDFRIFDEGRESL